MQPNAGKSSLLNLLANREAAIVSPIAGTTRDVIEVTMDLGGVRCIVSDTAGVREESSTGDIIEVEGMKRARKVASDAHVLVCMMDASDDDNENGHDGGVTIVNELLEDSSNAINSQGRQQSILFVKNKIDLVHADKSTSLSSQNPILEQFIDAEEHSISCQTNQGIDPFVDALSKKVVARVSVTDHTTFTNDDDNEQDKYVIEDDGAVITRARHRRHVEGAVRALSRFQVLGGQGYMALDMAAEELRLAASELGRITGAVDVEDVLDVLFADFCIGK